MVCQRIKMKTRILCRESVLPTINSIPVLKKGHLELMHWTYFIKTPQCSVVMRQQYRHCERVSGQAGRCVLSIDCCRPTALFFIIISFIIIEFIVSRTT